MNIQVFMDKMKKVDKKVFNIMKFGIRFSIIFCLISSFVLSTYLLTKNLNAYYVGINLLKSGLFFLVGFIICGYAFNNILKEI